MTDETDKPVDRDAWRNLLARGGDGPSELTDARVRAAARRAIPPRAAGWWMPASLAASLLLAVLVVQWQYEQRAAPAIVSESDYAAPRAGATAPRQSEGLLQDSAAPVIRDESTVEAGAEREEIRLRLAPPPAVPPPLIDLPAANESRAVTGRSIAPPGAALIAPAVVVPEPAPAREDAAPKRAADKDLGEIVVTGSRRKEENRESTTPVTQITAQGVTGGELGNLQKSGEEKREPAEWYTEIEKLRAAGKTEEAERELEKLKAAHPGWVEEYLKQGQKKE